MFASFQRGQPLGALALVALLAVLSASASAQTCPFNNGGSDATNDGVVLTRYALGITGAPLTASTRYASLDPLQVKNNIECVGCALDMNGDGQIDTVDTTIIARHLAGFQGASLTAELALGVAPTASRPTTAAIVSFLVSGCATGPNGAFVQRGNAFGAAAVLGTTDVFDMKVASGGGKVSLEVAGGHGVSVVRTSGLFGTSSNVINGVAANSVGSDNDGSVIAGGGGALSACYNPATFAYTAPCSNRIGPFADFSSLSGGYFSRIDGQYSTIGVGGSNVAGLFGGGGHATVAGGQLNAATGFFSAIPGGYNNFAGANGSFAAGKYARAAHDGSFVWGDDSTTIPIGSNAANQFVIRSAGGVHLNPATRLYFGQQTRQIINLWGTSTTTPDEFGIGVQTATAYFRSNSNFCWHKGGTHSDPFCTPGGSGTVQMALRDTAAATTAIGHLYAASFNIGSDRAVKTAIASINPRSVLSKVLSMPITSWAYKTDSNTRHIGPMAQDFHKAFGLGGSNKSIATVDADGVALAAIQGLHQIVKDKDAKIGALEKLNAAMQRKLAAIEKRLGM